jgi:hypothetical protein
MVADRPLSKRLEKAFRDKAESSEKKRHSKSRRRR